MNEQETEYLHSAGGGLELVFLRGGAREYPWHFHARHWTFGRVEKGGLELETLAGTSKLGPGGGFSLAAREPHRLAVRDESAVLVACVAEEFLGREPAAEVTRELSDLAGPAGLTADLAWLENAVSHAAELMDRHDEPEGENRLQPLFDQLISSPDDKFSLEQMAEAAGYSPWHFLRLFRQTAGVTPHFYQLICRLSLARSLLRSGTAAAEAAAAAGFTDQSHLHKLFKKQHGLTPGQFLRASFTRKP